MTGADFADHVPETLAWQLLAELVRRHAQLWIQTDTHSIGSEQAFIVDLMAASTTPIGFLGLPGTNATSMVAPGPPVSWRSAYASGDARDWIRDFEQSLRLEPPTGRLPASTPSSLAIRWVSGFLRAQLGARDQWLAGGAHRWPPTVDGWHGLVPNGSRWPGQRAEPHPIEPIFVGRAGGEPPTFALTTAGDLWDRDDNAFKLASVHEPGAPITALLLRTVPEFLP